MNDKTAVMARTIMFVMMECPVKKEDADGKQNVWKEDFNPFKIESRKLRVE